MANRADIYAVVGEEYYRDWLLLNNISLHFKDDSRFGLVSQFMVDGILFINSISKNDEPFTVGMNRLIIKLIRENDKAIVMSTCKGSVALNKLMDDYHEQGVMSFFTKGI